MNLFKDPRTNWKYVFIVIILAIIVGAGLLISQLNWPLFPTQEEKTTCDDSLDCPSQKKCEDSFCIDVGCIEEGGYGPSAGINPEWLDHLPKECCEDLEPITYYRYYNENCVWQPLAGAPSKVCTRCGNGHCEEGKGETKCNCSEDCK